MDSKPGRPCRLSDNARKPGAIYAADITRLKSSSGIC
jgi:hypothetical protein